MSVRKRRGFTLVELLVVISIIGMLMALLIPAVQQARETARSNTCRNNLTNLVKAIINYESTTQTYPGYQQTLTSRKNHAMQVSWLVPILRQLDRPDVDNQIRSFPTSTETVATPVRVADGTTLPANPTNPTWVTTYEQSNGIDYPDPPFFEILLCPSDASRTKAGQVSHYVVNCGRADNLSAVASLGISVDFPDNGVFQASGPLYFGPISGFSDLAAPNKPRGGLAQKVGSGFVTRGDGLSTTLMLSENTAPHDWSDLEEWLTGFVWWPTLDPIDNSPQGGQDFSMVKINGNLGQEPSDFQTTPRLDYARPSSYHPGGVNVAFAGGNVRFISEELTYHVFIMLMTPNGRQAKDPNGLKWNDPSGVWASSGVFTQFINPGTPLNEKDIIP